jgi:hypothetical protein
MAVLLLSVCEQRHTSRVLQSVHDDESKEKPKLYHAARSLEAQVPAGVPDGLSVDDFIR